MSKPAKATLNLDKLEETRKSMGDDWRARVGILGSDATKIHKDTGITNAVLGLIQIFGSISRNIPPRDCLIMPIERNKQELMRTLGKNKMREAFNRKDYKKMYEILGNDAWGFVQQAFETGGFGQWPPNKPATIAAKHSDSPLIDTKEFRDSFTYDVVKKDEAEGAIAKIS